jgi:hypothetical protein
MANTKTARSRLGYLLALASAALAAGTIAPAGASGGSGGHSTDCEREFEAAQRQDMESFRDYDVESFRAIHHEDAVTIFASGRVVQGADEIIAALHRHFEEREAVWSWTELLRQVHGCRTAYILYDTTYFRPSDGAFQHAIVGVTYTREHSQWLAIADQGTLLPADA